MYRKRELKQEKENTSQSVHTNRQKKNIKTLPE